MADSDLSPAMFDPDRSLAAMGDYWGSKRSWLYFIQCHGSPGLRLIGCAAKPDNRLGQLQVGSPAQLDLVGVTLGGEQLLKRLEQAFQDRLYRGRWYMLNAHMELYQARLIPFDPPARPRSRYLESDLAGLPSRIHAQITRADDGTFEVADKHMPHLYGTAATRRLAVEIAQSVAGRERRSFLRSCGLLR